MYDWAEYELLLRKSKGRQIFTIGKKKRTLMKSLYDELFKYGESDYYPYHMPGHKRHRVDYLPEGFTKVDITEIEGFDNLHAPEGIIKEAQEFAAKAMGAKHTYFLVGGSSCGVLAAISATVPRGGILVMSRGAHKSAYNAAILRQIKPEYIYPDVNEKYCFPEAPTAKMVEDALVRTTGKADAVFIVSPTYEGRVADVESIAKIVHKKGKILIVDEAHGAHLPFAKKAGLAGKENGYPESAIFSGADIVIQSTHKTLPAPTQTALLHICSDRVNRELIEKYLRIYQSSSPSYPLMVGIDGAVRFMHADEGKLLKRMAERFSELESYINTKLKYIETFRPSDNSSDIGKLIISASKVGLTGKELADILRSKYHLETEMSTEKFVLAMFTVFDADEGYERMKAALSEIDFELAGKCDMRDTKLKAGHEEGAVAEGEDGFRNGASDENAGDEALEAVKRIQPEVVLSISDAWDSDSEKIPLKEAGGRIACDFINLYPPGTPIIVPGERISKECVSYLKDCLSKGLNLNGITDGYVSVLKM